MAKNGAKGGGRRGAIRGRSQFKLPNGHYAKRDTRTGEIISIKADLKPWKGVVQEKHPPISLPTRRPLRPRTLRANLQPIPGRPVRRTRVRPASDRAATDTVSLRQS